MENTRTESARDHDDSSITEGATGAPGDAARSGGNLARDVGTQDELARVRDPDNTERVTKQDDINNDAAYDSDRARGG